MKAVKEKLPLIACGDRVNCNFQGSNAWFEGTVIAVRVKSGGDTTSAAAAAAASAAGSAVDKFRAQLRRVVVDVLCEGDTEENIPLHRLRRLPEPRSGDGPLKAGAVVSCRTIGSPLFKSCKILSVLPGPGEPPVASNPRWQPNSAVAASCSCSGTRYTVQFTDGGPTHTVAAQQMRNAIPLHRSIADDIDDGLFDDCKLPAAAAPVDGGATSDDEENKVGTAPEVVVVDDEEQEEEAGVQASQATADVEAQQVPQPHMYGDSLEER